MLLPHSRASLCLQGLQVNESKWPGAEKGHRMSLLTPPTLAAVSDLWRSPSAKPRPFCLTLSKSLSSRTLRAVGSLISSRPLSHPTHKPLATMDSVGTYATSTAAWLSLRTYIPKPMLVLLPQNSIHWPESGRKMLPLPPPPEHPFQLRFPASEKRTLTLKPA